MLFHLVYRFCATGATVRYRPNCGHKLDGGSTDLTDRLKAKGSAQCLIAAASGRPRIVGIRLIFIAPHPEDQHTREGADLRPPSRSGYRHAQYCSDHPAAVCQRTEPLWADCCFASSMSRARVCFMLLFSVRHLAKSCSASTSRPFNNRANPRWA